jgi:Mrp family chromosome partitioning ATPase/capsular polysaccharide biosynthesis protein
MEPIEYLRGLRRRWRVIVAATLIGLSAAWFSSLAIENDAAGQDQQGEAQYQASVLMLDARGAQPTTGGTGVVSVPTETLPVLVTVEDVAKRARKRLGVRTAPSKLASTVEASADDRTSVLTITATADQPKAAERLADAFARGLSDYLIDQRNFQIKLDIGTLRKQLNGLSSDRSDASTRVSLQGQIGGLEADQAAPLGLPIVEHGVAEKVEEAGISGPTSQAGRLLVGLIAGLLGGIVIALILERLDRRIRTRQAAEQFLAVPFLGEIPTIRRSRRVETTVRPLSAGSDAFRLLASAVLHAMKVGWIPSDGKGHRPLPSITIAVTSSEKGEGKSLVTANLAGALGELGLTVIVVSCDLRRPTLHRFFDAPLTPGVADALQAWDGRAGLEWIRHETYVPHVTIVPSGTPTQRPAAVLAAEELGELLRLAGEEADVVILDTPALMSSGEAASLLPRADGVLLVARLGKLSIDSAELVSDTLERLGSPTIGFALNGARRSRVGWHRSPSRSSGSPAPFARPAQTPERSSGLAAFEAESRR